jgi:hypothetical protein
MLDDRTPDLAITIALLCACAGAFIYGRHVAGRPADLTRVRMIPWNAVLIGLGFVMLLLLVHLVNVLGFETGPARR